MATAKEKIKANQLLKAEEVEKADTRQRINQYNSDSRNKVDKKDGVEGMMSKKPKSSVGMYRKSLEIIEKYNKLSGSEKDKLNKMEKEEVQQAKMYVKEIASQTSHKSMKRSNRLLMQGMSVEDDE